MELLIALVGSIIGATSVWAVNIYRAKVDHQTAINRQMLSKRLICAEKLSAISFKATRKMSKSGNSISYEEVESKSQELMQEMWEVIDTYGVYFEEEEYKELVDIPDYFILRLKAERKKAEKGDGGIENWDWIIAFLEGQAVVRQDIKTVCLRSIDYSRTWPKSGNVDSKLKLKEQYNQRIKRTGLA